MGRRRRLRLLSPTIATQGSQIGRPAGLRPKKRGVASMAASLAHPHQCLTIALQALPTGWRVGLRKRRLGAARTKGRVVLRLLVQRPADRARRPGLSHAQGSVATTFPACGSDGASRLQRARCEQTTTPTCFEDLFRMFPEARIALLVRRTRRAPKGGERKPTVAPSDCSSRVACIVCVVGKK